MHSGNTVFTWSAVHFGNRTEVRVVKHKCRTIDGKGQMVEEIYLFIALYFLRK